MLCYLSLTVVPPVVVSLTDNQQVIGNATDAVTVEFAVDNAAPLVALEDLTWYYSPSLVAMPQGEDITGLMNRTSQSMLTFSPFASNTMISLTVSNLVRDVAGEGETDEGRYFLVARNPAGISFDYTDLVIFGECYSCYMEKQQAFLVSCEPICDPLSKCINISIFSTFSNQQLSWFMPW